MNIPVFVGPTLSGELAPGEFSWRQPAKEGDFYKAALRKPVAIGLIDGQFEVAPSVWHKEILWALTQGIYVFGAASLGALRAAELTKFGMIGVGAIYKDYCDCTLTDDDEVTIVHAPAELQYRPLTDAMADIRATLIAAQEANVLSERTAYALTAIAKKLFFKNRTWDRILRIGEETNGLSHAQGVKFKNWLPANKVDQKRNDARAMLKAMRELLGGPIKPFKPAFEFSNTVHWQQAIRQWSKKPSR